MSMRTIMPKPLKAEHFAQYGDVIEASDKAQHFSINAGFTERYHDLALVDTSQQG